VGSPHLIVQLKNINMVKDLKPDLLALSDLNQEIGAVSTHIYALDAISPLAMAHTRTFAPAIGIPEIVASGTVSGALGAYLVNKEIIRGNSPITFIAEQGHSLNKPCEITVVVYFKRTSVNLLKVTGEATTVMEGEIAL
jgi:trans-2,3-dihydro-3-hydroxyanthranilate isomerase